MTLLFSSLRMGLISVPPNVLPLLFTLAWMGITDVYLNTTTVIIFSISIGLAVDDTIHMLARFDEEMARGVGLDEALRRAAAGSGRAIVITSVMLVGGLAVMGTSSFVPIRLFSELTGVTIVGCLFGDLIVLPALLKLGWRPAKQNDAGPQDTARETSPPAQID
jgi:predicted RND superfamily exporter protein